MSAALQLNQIQSVALNSLMTGRSGSNISSGQTGISFRNHLLSAASTEAATSPSSIDEYTEYLKSKYGNVTIKSTGKDQKSLERAGSGMSGNDIVIAPNILQQMANDPEKAAYYEQKIDYFFDALVPRETASFAARGLVFEPGGVVVHDDGTVTYISGCSDSPERVAEVNAINEAKIAKRAAQRKEIYERGVETAEQRRREANERYLEKALLKPSTITINGRPERGCHGEIPS